ncbi:MAG: hypothetical protein QHI38_08165 [Armatimonadota bacterium]|nr:hypothetical protein [Armatimonadota bacterium]
MEKASTRVWLVFALLALCSASAVGSVVGASFLNLGLGNPTGAVMYGDHPVVVFHNTNTAGPLGVFLWSTLHGTVQLDTAGDSAGIAVQGVNLVVAGNATAGAYQARYWQGTPDGSGTWTTLPFVDGSRVWMARGIAASDTQILIVGSYLDANNCDGACRWRWDVNSASSLQLPRKTGFPMGDAYHNRSMIYGVSAVGPNPGMGTMAGQCQYPGSGCTGGARQPIGGWNLSISCLCGFKNLNGYPDNKVESVARVVARDGSRIAGFSYESSTVSTNRWACYWDAPFTEHGVEPVKIPLLPGHNYAESWAISEDGYVIGGFSLNTANNPGSRTGWIWDPVNGVRDIRDVLTENGIDISGWQFTNITAICDGGAVIAGTGWRDGDTTKTYAWVATGLPKPPKFTSKGTTGVGAYAPVTHAARAVYPFVVWGRVVNDTYLTSNSFNLDDGSGKLVRVFSNNGHPAYYPGAFVRVKGRITRTNPPLILTTYDDVLIIPDF